jgi:ligand-binding sensor domain-containing protein
MKSIRCALFASFVLAAAPPGAPAASAPLDEYVLTSWADELRAFASEVNGIAQDADGYLWLATDNGILRFDGVRFVRATPDQLVPLSSVYRGKEGSIWIGPSASGIGRIKREQVRRYDDKDGFPGRRVTQFAEDTEGHLYSASRVGLYRLVRDRWQRVGPAEGLPDGPVYTVFRDSAGHLWVGTSEGIFRRAAGEPQFRLFTDSTRSYFPEFAEVRGRGLWITDPQLGLRRLDEHTGGAATTRALLRGAGTKIIADRAGHVWLATAGQGLWFVRNPASPQPDIRVLNTTNGFPADTVLSLLEDREGNIWVRSQQGINIFFKFSAG